MVRMKKLVTSILAIMFTASLLVGNVSAMEKSFVEEEYTKIEKTVRKLSYKEGEALVLYEQGTPVVSGYSASLKSNFGTDIEIIDTWNFDEDNQISVKRASNTTDRQTVQITLVKSAKDTTEELVKKLNNMEGVEIAEPNYQYKSSEASQGIYKKYQWALVNQGQNAGTLGLDIKAETEILTSKETSDKDKVIAIIDTGIDYTHEALKDKVWNNPYTDSLKGKHGYDFYNMDADPFDDNGHGTHCAGIIAADNRTSISGVATGENVKIMALKFLDEDGYGWEDDAISAYNYIYRAQQLGVNVIAINNSWGGDEYSAILEKVINLVGGKGAISVCAAGNYGTDNDKIPHYPANYDSSYVISVAATNEEDELASFSSYGVNTVDIAAPGTNILSSVVQDTFNPTIYEQTADLCSVFLDFSGNLIDSPYQIAGSRTENVSVETTESEFFGESNADAKSLVWKITDAEEGEYYDLYILYLSEVSATPIYSSIMVKGKGPKIETESWWISSILFGEGTLSNEGVLNAKAIAELGIEGEDNYWNHLSGKIRNKVNVEESRVIVLRLNVENDGDYEIYVDDVAVSKANVDAADFGKYDFYNGTSMAAPHVTGAIAVLSNAIPELEPEGLRNYISGSVREVGALGNTIRNGGTLDLSEIENQKPIIKSITLNQANQIVIAGYFFGDDPGIKANGVNVTPIEKSDKTIRLNSNRLLNKNVEVEIEVDGYKVSETFYFATGKDFTTLGTIANVFDGGNVTTDGNNLYYMNDMGMICSWNPSDVTTDDELVIEVSEEKYWEILASGYDQKALFGQAMDTVISYTILPESEVIYSDKKLWTILRLDLGYADEVILAYFDLGAKKWVNASTLPKDYLTLKHSTLAAYEGKMYVIGGYDTKNKVASSLVRSFDLKQGKWNEEINIPEGRYSAKAMQVENKLVVTLGGVAGNEVPGNLIYDGAKWTTGSSMGKVFKTSEFSYEVEDASRTYIKVPYYTAQIGLVKNGLIYTGLEADDLGDTFIYQLNGKFTRSDYCVLRDKKNQMLFATTLGDTLYAMSGKQMTGEDETSEIFKISTIPVSNGCIQATQTATTGGMVEGLGNYLPGQEIVITPVAYEDYFLKKLEVNGKAVTGSTYSTRANTTNITVKATFGAYITAMEISALFEELQAGKTMQLNVIAEPVEADSKAVIWSTSNSNYATVDANGKITAKLAGVGNIVTITATAKDRKLVTANCEVLITPADIDSTVISTKARTISTITLKWSKVTDAKGYYVYRATSKKGRYTKIKTITNRSAVTYRDNRLKSGKVYYYKVVPYVTIDGKDISGEASPILTTATQPKTPKIAVTAGVKRITISWKKISGANGYEVYRAASKSGKYTKVITITKGNTVKYTNSKLQSKKTYYYKVRAYKTVSGKKVYSSWSAAKNVRAK